MDPFAELERHYPEIIQRMDRRFNAHQFIRELSRQYQGLYIQALAQYAGHTSPFMIVHGRLAKALSNWSDLVCSAGDESSTDVFGQPNSASVWVKR